MSECRARVVRVRRVCRARAVCVVRGVVRHALVVPCQ